MTDKKPSRAVRLFGTDEPVSPPRIVRAGALSAEFEAGNLRYIRYGGIEMIRAIPIDGGSASGGGIFAPPTRTGMTEMPRWSDRSISVLTQSAGRSRRRLPHSPAISTHDGPITTSTPVSRRRRRQDATSSSRPKNESACSASYDSSPR